ncbi:MAG: hypothetical protein OXH09_17825 [Gammaproteobacteria bacterium]|nr:hypothetical protein [Gammaproteobacteria bacterium]
MPIKIRMVLTALGIGAVVWPGIVCFTTVPIVFLWHLLLPRSLLFEFALTGAAMIFATLASIKLYRKAFVAGTAP